MADKQYDVSSEMRRLFDLKQKQRAAAKEYYMKLLYNPYRPPNQGAPFDPALQRFSAMSAYHSANFKPNAKHWAGFILYLTPFFGMMLLERNYTWNKEKRLRSGVVAYADRDFKLIL